MNEINLTNINKKQTCEICGCELSHAETLHLINVEYVICQSFDCRHIMNQKAYTHPLQFKSQVHRQRQCVEDRRQKEQEKNEFLEQSSKRENEENKGILNSILIKHPELTDKISQTVVIPSGLSRPIPLTQDRLTSLTDHLNKIIREAETHINSDSNDLDQHLETRNNLISVEKQFQDNPEMKTNSDKICGMCKGGCCTSGKEHAYLSAINIVRYMKDNPDLSAADILNRYLSNIPSKTIAGACINQTITGCAQPKELRSDTCNSFYCESLKTYHSNFKNQNTAKTVLLIQRSGTCWNQIGSGVTNEVVNITLVKEDDENTPFRSPELIQELISTSASSSVLSTTK